MLGRVKTRLAAGVGQETALAVYRELLAVTHKALQQTGVPATVWLVEAEGNAALQEAEAWLQHNSRYQGPGDLGQRMATAFAAAFAEGAGRVAIIGTDCPGLRATHLTQALDLLHENDVVLGPAADGGYYLLGLRQPQPELFEHKAWSTGSVLSDTVADAHRLGLRVALLPQLQDIDTAEDLYAWRAGKLE